MGVPRGVTTGEYALLLGLLAIAVIAAAQLLGRISGQGFGVAERALSTPSTASANDIVRP